MLQLLQPGHPQSPTWVCVKGSWAPNLQCSCQFPTKTTPKRVEVQPSTSEQAFGVRPNVPPPPGEALLDALEGKKEASLAQSPSEVTDFFWRQLNLDCPPAFETRMPETPRERQTDRERQRQRERQSAGKEAVQKRNATRGTCGFCT